MLEVGKSYSVVDNISKYKKTRTDYLWLKVTCDGEEEEFLKEDEKWFEVKDGNNIYIVRKWEKWVTNNSKSATFGEFTFDNLSGYICEPYGEETATSGLDKRIPVGKYNIKWHTSTKYNKKLYTKSGKYGKKNST